jgi:hypothetical protein
LKVIAARTFGFVAASDGQRPVTVEIGAPHPFEAEQATSALFVSRGWATMRLGRLGGRCHSGAGTGSSILEYHVTCVRGASRRTAGLGR